MWSMPHMYYGSKPWDILSWDSQNSIPIHDIIIDLCLSKASENIPQMGINKINPNS